MRKPEANDIMAISEITPSTEVPKVRCVIRDLTQGQPAGEQRAVNLPASYTVQDLIEHVAKDYDYETESFKLSYERDAQLVSLDQRNRPLGEVVRNCGNGKLNKFQIDEVEDGVAPTKRKVGSIQFNDMANSIAEVDSRNVAYNTTGGYNNTSYSSTLLSPQSGSGSTGNGRFCGLVNQAMTCYLNSLLQTLFMTPEFRNALYSWRYSGQGPTPEDKCIPYQLQRLFLQMQTGNHTSVETTPVTRSFGWDSSHSWQQHDVQELCRVMFDALEINWKETQQANLINELYQGKLKDYVKCLECKTESFRTDAYLDIPLVIKPFGATHSYPSVEDALRAFVEPEILKDNNQYQCDNCGKKCDAHKGLKFESFPYLLTLQLKRFDFDYSTMSRIKLNDKMTFPSILDLNSLIDDSGMPSTPDVNADGSYEPSFSDMLADGGNYGSSVDSDHFDDDQSLAQEPGTEKGEYVYELFSIMIHSGSAVGGHYYAYIKCFGDDLWYSFNDQSVARITKEDITKTYGGTGTRGLFSTTYTSSTNAYMLMYRKRDAHRNSDFMDPQKFPQHIKELIDRMDKQTEASNQAREVERSTCKVRTFVYKPGDHGNRTHKTLHVHKDATVAEATQLAYKLFELEGLVSQDCVRLVKYNGDLDSIEKSFEGSGTSCIGDALGGVKSVYVYELLLEIKQSHQEWQQYRTGGVTYKVHTVDLDTELVQPGVRVRLASDDTFTELKLKIARVLELAPSDYMRCIMERRNTADLIPILDDKRPIKDLSLLQSARIFVDGALSETADCTLPFAESRLKQLIARYQQTIRLLLTVPSSTEIQKFVDKENSKRHLYLLNNDCKADKAAAAAPPSSLHVVEGTSAMSSDPPPSYDEIDTGYCSLCSSRTSNDCQCNSSAGKDDDMPLGACADSIMTEPDSKIARSSADTGREDAVWDYTGPGGTKANGTVSDSAASQLMDTSAGAVDTPSKPVAGTQSINQPDEEGSDHVPDKQLDTSAESEEQEDRFYSEESIEEVDSKTTMLKAQVDKKISMKRLKRLLGKRLNITTDQFKLYKIYPNNQEMECTGTADSLTLLTDDTRMSVKLGRVLQKGEYRVKIFELDINSSKEMTYPHVVDLIVTKGMTIAQSKEYIAEELRAEYDREVLPERIRLRKKTWKNPGPVFLDHEKMEDEISMYSNWEMYLQLLDAPEPVTSQDVMLLFVQQWKPAVYEFGPVHEIVIPSSSSDLPLLKAKLSDVTNFPVERLEVAKSRSFPRDISVLDAHTTGLDWNPNVTFLTSWPVYLDNGSLIIYRDKDDELGTLTAERRKEISVKEAANSHYPSSSTYSRKEKALKIYTHSEPSAVMSSNDGTSSVVSHTNDLD